MSGLSRAVRHDWPLMRAGSCTLALMSWLHPGVVGESDSAALCEGSERPDPVSADLGQAVGTSSKPSSKNS